MENDITNKLLDKAKEAFVMAIEIYNKPTIRYRVEGFSFFICNAWELMLKARMIKTYGETSIYYKDNPNRTITLENCIQKIFTNEKDPLRLNLEKIVELRNTSTHFITEEYEMIYVPLFQACILNFNDKIFEFFDIDMTQIIPQNFLTLSVSLKSLNESEIYAKYPEIVSKKFLNLKNSVDELTNSENSKFAININVNHFLTKNRSKADAVFHIAKDGEDPVTIIKEIKDPNLVYKNSVNDCIKTIEKMLNRSKIIPKYRGEDAKITTYHFYNLVKYFGLKNDSRFSLKFTVGNSSDFYKYSAQAVEFLVEEIKKDPENILDNIKKISQPQGQRNS